MADSVSKSVYIDEDIGKDDATADGSETVPFKTLLYAFSQFDPATEGIQYLTRKSQTGPVGDDGSEAVRLEWKPATKSAMKKQTSIWEAKKKKIAKEQSLAIREKEELEKRQLVLEEARKVVIEEDSSLPRPVRIRLDVTDSAIVKLGSPDSDTRGTRVRVLGRIHRLRPQKGVIFLTLYDG